MKHIILVRLVSLLAIGLLVVSTGCRSTPESALQWTLTGTVWKVAELEGEMVGAEKIPTLQLEPDGNRVSAFGGINRMAGSYKLDGSALSFGQFASTRMAAPEKLMKIETHFEQVLAAVTNYRIKGNYLILLAGEKVVARAQATPAIKFAAP